MSCQLTNIHFKMHAGYLYFNTTSQRKLMYNNFTQNANRNQYSYLIHISTIILISLTSKSTIHKIFPAFYINVYNTHNDMNYCITDGKYFTMIKNANKARPKKAEKPTLVKSSLAGGH